MSSATIVLRAIYVVIQKGPQKSIIAPDKKSSHTATKKPLF